MDGVGLVARLLAAAADGALVGGGAHGVDVALEGEGPLEALVAKKLADLARPALAYPFSQMHVARLVFVFFVDFEQVPVALSSNKVSSEGGGGAGKGVKDLEAAALLVLELIEAALAVGGDHADCGIFLLESLVVSSELLDGCLRSGNAGVKR